MLHSAKIAAKACDTDMLVARDLTRRYLIALLLVASLATAAWLSLHLVITEQKSTAAIVNISGRQRMLSQRTTLFANLLATAPASERAAVKATLEKTLELLAHSHQGLIQGDPELGLPNSMSATVHALYFEPPIALDAEVNNFIQLVHHWIQLPETERSAEHALLKTLTHEATTNLLQHLDQMVRQYQLEGEASVKRLQYAETIFWGLTLLLLVLEALLIFQPFVQHVRIIITKLQLATRNLQVHESQLEHTIQLRTAELEQRSAALAESEEKFRLISTAAKDAIVIIDEAELIIYWNPAAEHLFGYSANDILGKNFRTLLMPQEHTAILSSGIVHFLDAGTENLVSQTLEAQAIHQMGTEFPIELSISAFKLQNSWHAISIMRDITERKHMEQQIRQLAFYDPLTNLPNRRLFHDRLTHAIFSAKRKHQYVALMLLDLDNFKSVNDDYGHVMGDQLLVEVAKRLSKCVRAVDTIARLGGDEFVVLLTELEGDEAQVTTQIGVIAEKIRIEVSRPYQLQSNQANASETDIVHQCSASIGVIAFDSAELAPEDIIKKADASMYQAKRMGRNQIQFSH